MWKNGLWAFYSLYIIFKGHFPHDLRIQRRETILTHFCGMRWVRRSAGADLKHRTWWSVASESFGPHPRILSRIVRIHPLYFSGFVSFPVTPKTRSLACSWPYTCTLYDTGYRTDSGAWDFCLKVSLFRRKIECWPTAALWETQYFVLYWLLIWGLCSAHTHCLGSLLCFTCSTQGFHTYLIF